jgi:hypothetical protein
MAGVNDDEIDDSEEYDESADLEWLPNTRSGTRCRKSDRSKRSFGEVDDLAENAQRDVGSPPSARKVRREHDLSESRNASANMAFVPMSENPDWLVGKNLGSLFESSSLALPPNQTQSAYPSAPLETQNDQIAESCNATGMQVLQAPGSSLGSNSNQQANMQPLQNTVQVSQQRPQPSNQQRQHLPFENTTFPSRQEQLPPGLTLTQICQDYPNHLHGRGLRPFMEARWSARNIWEAMRDNAQISASKRRPWNRFERRIGREKKVMTEEEEARRGTRGEFTSQGSAPTKYSDQGILQNVVAGVQRSLMNDVQSDAGKDQSASPHPTTALPGETVQDGELVVGKDQSTSPQPTAAFPGKAAEDGNLVRSAASSAVIKRLKVIHGLMSTELQEQKGILSAMMLYDDPEWLFKSARDRARINEEEWMRHAKAADRILAADRNLDADNLEFEPTTIPQMLLRQNTLLQESHRAAMFAPGSSKSIVPENSVDETRLAAYEEQIVIVQGWTVEWNKELEQRSWSHPDGTTNRVSRLEFPNIAQPVGHGPERPNPGSVIVDPQLLNLSPTANESSLHTPNHSLLQGCVTAQRLDAPQYPLPVISRNDDQQYRDDGVTQQNPYPYLRNSRFPWERSASSTGHESANLPSSGMPASSNTHQSSSAQNFVVPTTVFHTVSYTAAHTPALEPTMVYTFPPLFESDDLPGGDWYHNG